MSDLGEVFDATSVAPSQPMDVIPPGDYVAQIVNSEMRDTKGGSGRFLWLELAILEGPMANRRVFDRLNLVNANTDTVKWARESLSAICHATGQMQVSNSEQLHYKPFIVTVKVRPAGPDKQGTHREAQNDVKGYKPAGSTPAQPARVAATPTAQPAASKTPPWKRTAA